MTKKILHSVLFAAIAVMLASLVIVMSCLYDYLGAVQEKRLKDELDLAASAVELSGWAYFETLASDDYRITWVAADGTVLFDTQVSAESMENHADREEIQEALAAGEGSSSRYSATLTEKTLYYAKALGNGTVLRISASQLTALALVLAMLQPIAYVVVIAIVLSIVLAHWMAKRVVEPLNRLDLDHPLENDAYEELTPLLKRLHQQRQQISAQLRDLQEKTDEFTQITKNMSEGLVLLNDRGIILSINPAAQRIFHADPACGGQDFLTIERSREVDRAIRTALADGHSEIRMERDGRDYQLGISRIESDGAVIGTVLLAFDVTEQAFAEQNRREFTANVSHELKTPLQSIIGSAELMENGLVKAEDVPRFVGHIRAEAARLVTLIEDIIRLSQLDEGVEMSREDVDLLEVAKDMVSTLRDSAEAKKVQMSVTGTSMTINGVRRLLEEMIYNLCDNAVKYNVEGGSVEITVSGDAQKAIVTVKDTGIGIPPEYQSRVFERFFRVDKSHSKASGGTGLGLSIVKHTAQYHHARIDLRSEPGKGTEISVAFPMKTE